MLQSVQLSKADFFSCFGRSNSDKTQKEKKELSNNSNVDNNFNKSKYLTAGLGCMAVAGAAAVAIRTKNKKTAIQSIKPYQEEFYNFSAFLKKLKEANINTAADYLANCTEKNILGTGQNSVVYKFDSPLLENWVIKVNTKHNDFTHSFNNVIQQTADVFSGFNMGQEIARFDDTVKILKRIDAKPHSVKDWSAHRKNNTEITVKEASDFLADVKNIAKFPQETFDDFARKLKIIDDKGYKADSFNPHNYLIDYKNKSIYIIDFYKYDVDAHLNTKYDLWCPLVDYPNFEKFYNVMTPAQKKEFVQATGILDAKCTKAAQASGVNTSESVFKDFIGRIDGRENNGNMYTHCFDTMKNICAKSNLTV